MLCIVWEYLTGRAVATDPADRSEAEWPPHPDRVFQALVAAWGETGRLPAGRSALEWLEALPPPQVCAPRLDPEGPATTMAAPAVYVPANDVAARRRTAEYRESMLELLPAHRTRSARTFPSIWVGEAPCGLVWQQAEAGDHRAALDALCARVTHVGHSSSLVRMGVADVAPSPAWEPTVDGPMRELSLRVTYAGRLEFLEAAYAGGGPGWRRPPAGRWQAYGPPRRDDRVLQGAFSEHLVVLRRSGGDVPGLLQAQVFASALRKALMAAAGEDAAAMALVSGHSPAGGGPECDHAAILALPAVGHPHADGHLLGFAVALPRAVDADGEQSLLGAISRSLDRETGSVRVRAGPAGAVDLVPEDRMAPPMALRPSSWCRTAAEWGTVTPIVLDRLPPRRLKDASKARPHSAEWDAFDRFVVDQISQACERQGLPRPASVVPGPVSAHVGCPPARAFAPSPRRSDGAPRWHTHARIVFARPVRGPLVLGAGRYLGMGLCKSLASSVGDDA